MRLAWRLRRELTTGRAEGAPTRSPLNALPALYCRWSVHRRAMDRAVDDRVSGEATAPFTVRGTAVDLDAVTLHLSEHLTDAWTARWAGLPPALQELLTRELPGHEPEALYHCTQVLLPPGATVTWVPGLLTDLGPDEAAAWALRRAVWRLAPAVAMVVAGWVEL